MRRPRLVPLLALAGAVTMMLLLGATASSYGPAPASTWAVSGGTQSGGLVSSVAVAGSTAYLGGNFDYVGPETGSFVGVDSTSSSLVSPWPTVGGSVFAVASDAAGGFFIGGFFTSIGSKHVDNIAHIKSDGTLDTSWSGGTNGTVYAIQVSGSTVYAGGAFTTAGGAAHVNLAAFDRTTGAVSASFPDASGPTAACISGQGPCPFVASLRLSGGSLYVGGLFTTLGDSTRTNIGAITTINNSVSAWAPSTDGIVYAVAVSVGGTVYVGGAFTHATGGAGTFERTFAAAFNGTSGAVTVWDPGPDDQVYALEVVGSTVYAGGTFANIGATPDSRNGLAALTAASGDLASWNPRLSSGAQVYSISAPGNGATVYVGGSFGTVNTSTARDNVAGFEAATGNATGLWSIVGGNVDALALSGTTLGVGGEFRTAGGGNGSTAAPLHRSNLAAIDLNTGTPTNWNPRSNDGVEVLAVSGSRVYAGGEFTVVNGGVARQRVAAFDMNLGTATAWDPSVHDGAVFALAIAGSTVYAGGTFTSVSKTVATPTTPSQPIPRGHVAAFDADGSGNGFGDLKSWDPNATFSTTAAPAVFALDVVGSTVFIGGSFNRLRSNVIRSNLAAVPSDPNAVGIVPLSWNPNVSDSVFALAHAGSVEYAGGPFILVNGNVVRPAAAAFDQTTGTVTSWNPQFARDGAFAGTVYSLAASGSMIYASGVFRTVGGLWTNGSCIAPCFLSPEVAAVSQTTGAPNTSWAPGANDRVSSIALSQKGLVMGGLFTTVGIPPPGTLPVSADELTANYRGSVALVHALPDAPAVTATAGNGTAHVTITPPAYTGGTSIASYTLTTTPADIPPLTNVSSPVDLAGLTNGTTYTFSVTANSADGTTSQPSTATAKPRTVPSAPTGVTATPGDGRATVSFTAPNDGGDAITMYTVTTSPGNIVVTGTGTSILVPVLQNDHAYTFTVTATNGAGTSAASAPSDPITPHEGGRPHPSAPDPTPRPAVPDLPPNLPPRIPPPGHGG